MPSARSAWRALARPLGVAEQLDERGGARIDVVDERPPTPSARLLLNEVQLMRTAPPPL